MFHFAILGCAFIGTTCPQEEEEYFSGVLIIKSGAAQSGVCKRWGPSLGSVGKLIRAGSGLYDALWVPLRDPVLGPQGHVGLLAPLRPPLKGLGFRLLALKSQGGGSTNPKP